MKVAIFVCDYLVLINVPDYLFFVSGVFAIFYGFVEKK
jgi:hypothetical protein